MFQNIYEHFSSILRCACGATLCVCVCTFEVCFVVKILQGHGVQSKNAGVECLVELDESTVLTLCIPMEELELHDRQHCVALHTRTKHLRRIDLRSLVDAEVACQRCPTPTAFRPHSLVPHPLTPSLEREGRVGCNGAAVRVYGTN